MPLLRDEKNFKSEQSFLLDESCGVDKLFRCKPCDRETKRLYKTVDEGDEFKITNPQGS